MSSVFLAAALSGVAIITAALPLPVPQIWNPNKLQWAGVIDLSGKLLGRVTEVKTDADGKATRVKVALMTPTGPGPIASIRAEKLNYDTTNGVVRAQLTASEIKQLATTASTTDSGTGPQRQPDGSQGDGKSRGY